MHTDNQTLNCLIVDDEPLAQEVLATHIGKIPGLRLVQQSSNAFEAFEALHKNQVDLLFLDINMPVMNGLSFLRSLKEPPAVILTTAYTEYALEGYDLDVIDYLLKPISFDRFLKAVKKAVAQLQSAGRTIQTIADEPVQMGMPVAAIPGNVVNEKTFFFIKADGQLVKINYSDLRYVEGMKDYLKLHTTTGTIVTHHTMKAMEEQLPSGKFMRVHKSYIIALNAIRAIEGNIIYLDKEKTEIPLGSSYKEALLAVVSTS